MPVDDSLIGRTYPPSRVYEVSREKIREFADAIGDASPLYRDPEAAKAHGYPDVIAPPTFPIASIISSTPTSRTSMRRTRSSKPSPPVTIGWMPL